MPSVPKSGTNSGKQKERICCLSSEGLGIIEMWVTWLIVNLLGKSMNE